MSQRAAFALSAIASVGLIATNLGLDSTVIDVSPITMPTRERAENGAAATASLELQNSGPGDFAETFQRPIFSPTRRKPVPVAIKPEPAEPAVAAVTAPPAPAPVPPLVTPSLLGVSASNGGWRALLRANGKQETAWYDSGDVIDGWTVSEIGKGQVALEQGGQIRHLSLYPPLGSGRPLAAGGADAVR